MYKVYNKTHWVHVQVHTDGKTFTWNASDKPTEDVPPGQIAEKKDLMYLLSHVSDSS